MLKLGEATIQPMFLGDTEVRKAFLGGELVYQISNLPEGYTEVEYIRFNGNKNRFELLSRVTCDSDRLLVKVKPESAGTSTSSYQTILEIYIATATASRNYGIVLTSSGASTLYYRMNHIPSAYKTANVTMVGNLLTFDLDFSGNVYSVNSISLTGVKNSNVVGGSGKNIGSYSSDSVKGDFYGMKHYKSGELIHDYIPCINPDGVAGLFDSVSKTFIKNTHTSPTSVTAGPTV